MIVPLPIEIDRLAELREVLTRLDPAGRRKWRLEIHDRRDGEDVISLVIDLKTGQVLRNNAEEIKDENTG